MIKCIFCIKRHPTLTRQEFQEYWLNQFGPLYQEFAKKNNALRYVQNHTDESTMIAEIKRIRGFSPLEYDGIAEIWWQSEDDLIAARNTPDAKTLLSMEAKFIDANNSVALFTTEHVLFTEKHDQ